MVDEQTVTTTSRRAVLKASGASALTVGLAGCLEGISGDGSGDVGAVRIGLLFPQSGAYAVYGEDGGKAADLASEELNEGDGPGVEIIKKDTEISPETGVTRAREAVEEDDVDVLMGFASSSVALAVSEFGAGNDVVTISTVAQTPQLTSAECRRKTFRTAGDLVQINTGAAEATTQLTDISSDWDLASIYPDYVFGQETWNTYRDAIQDRVSGIGVVSEQAPAFGKGEYQNEIQSILDDEPDIVYSSLSGSDLVSFIRQAQQVDFFQQIEEFIHVSGAITDTSRALGDDMVEMIAADRYFYKFPDSERNNEFVSAFQDMHDEIPVNTGQETYAGIYAAHGAAAEGGGTDADTLVDTLEGFEWEAPEGQKRIRAEDHQSVEPNIWVGRVGEVDYADFYGFTEMNEVPGGDVIPESDCSF